MRRNTLLVLAGAVMAAMPVAVQAQAVFPETEPNDSKAAANMVGPMVAGDMITGNSISAATTGLDYFNVSLTPLPLGIYRHRLVLTSDIVGHTGTIRGLNQIAAPADTMPGIPWDGVVGTPGTTDSTLQTSSTTTTPPRFNQWYGFGRDSRVYYRVTGAAATTADYKATLETVPVAPTVIGTYAPGLITLNWNGQGHTTDTDMWVYDSNFNAIAGYGDDDSSAALSGAPIATTSLQSWLARTYAEGTYYIGVSNFASFNNLASPSDDNFRTGTLMDFPDAVANSSTTVGLNLAFTITDSLGASLAVPNTKIGPFDVNWFCFTVGGVVPEPTMLGLLAFALPLVARRRRV